jgi:hypothetical protein
MAINKHSPLSVSRNQGEQITVGSIVQQWATNGTKRLTDEELKSLSVGRDRLKGTMKDIPPRILHCNWESSEPRKLDVANTFESRQPSGI